jgi:predicted hydrocarbon binding protein
VVSLETGALPSYFCSHGVPGWFTAAVELSGGKAVEVREVHCVHRDAKRCSWELNWRR